MKSIWGQFDKDGGGTLDKEETRAFVMVALGNIGHAGFSDEVFDVLFKMIDKDGDGTLDPFEMFDFIKKFG